MKNQKHYKVKIEFYFQAKDENDALGIADHIADYVEESLLDGEIEAKVGNPKIDITRKLSVTNNN